MSVINLDSEEKSLYDHILSNTIESITLELLQAEDTTPIAKTLLHKIQNIVTYLSTTWNAEHDMQGKLIGSEEQVSSEDIENFFIQAQPIFEMIRSRFPILRSEVKIAVGTLINVHKVSELLELSLREKGYLTYYLGSELTVEEISTLLEKTPANTLVLSCMAENSELQCFEELRKVRATFPDLKILVGGSAFQMFLILKDNPDNPVLTQPYKEHSYYEKMSKADSLKNFVEKEFLVKLCENVDQIQQELDN